MLERTPLRFIGCLYISMLPTRSSHPSIKIVLENKQVYDPVLDSSVVSQGDREPSQEWILPKNLLISILSLLDGKHTAMCFCVAKDWRLVGAVDGGLCNVLSCARE